MQSLPIITYPYEWEPPAYHLGMTLLFDGEPCIVSGMFYQPDDDGELDKGWWYEYTIPGGSQASHETQVRPYVKAALPSKQLVY